MLRALVATPLQHERYHPMLLVAGLTTSTSARSYLILGTLVFGGSIRLNRESCLFKFVLCLSDLENRPFHLPQTENFLEFFDYTVMSHCYLRLTDRQRPQPLPTLPHLCTARRRKKLWMPPWINRTSSSLDLSIHLPIHSCQRVALISEDQFRCPPEFVSWSRSKS
jgi:hypothetical protein